jgi:hypothetical protein
LDISFLLLVLTALASLTFGDVEVLLGSLLRFAQWILGLLVSESHLHGLQVDPEFSFVSKHEPTCNVYILYMRRNMDVKLYMYM